MPLTFWLVLAVLTAFGLRDFWRWWRTPEGTQTPDPSWLGLPFLFALGTVFIAVMIVIGLARLIWEDIRSCPPDLCGPYRQVR